MKDIKAQLKWIYKLISNLQGSKIHYSQSTSWTRQNDEGYNDGIQLAITQLEKKAKQLGKKQLVTKSVCNQCRFENECRFKSENVEQNCKFFIDKSAAE